MAKTMLLECDRCRGKKDVVSMEATTSDRMNVDVELCKKCFDSFVKEYGARVTDRQNRRPFTVIDEADIPTA